jgi:fructokinase
MTPAPPNCPALGIDLGGTKAEAQLLAPDGRPLWRERRPTPSGSYADTVALLADLVTAARHAAGGGPISVGIGTPGALTVAGVMKNCNSTCLNGQPLQRDIEAAISQPVRLANDANCLALSEATDGAGAGAAVVFAVILGTGTGAGIAVHGRVLEGPNRIAGEWGHNPLPWAQPGADPAFACYCGQQGCLETILSGSGLARDHAHATGQALAGEAIVQRAMQGDAACQATLQRHAQRLARALAAVINLLDPDVIVLGGGLSRLQHLYTEVPALWAQWVFSGGVRDPVRTRLLPSLHGDASGVRGAAWLGAQGEPARAAERCAPANCRTLCAEPRAARGCRHAVALRPRRCRCPLMRISAPLRPRRTLLGNEVPSSVPRRPGRGGPSLEGDADEDLRTQAHHLGAAGRSRPAGGTGLQPCTTARRAHGRRTTRHGEHLPPQEQRQPGRL